MQSDGGLADVDDFSGSRAILSGPAGGVIGYALTGYDPAARIPVVGFDMGGTSTDVSRYAGSFDHVTESVTAGVIIQAPQLDINTVAAGGGSRLLFHNGMLAVGPESAGSDPGPSCYRKGGPLAITDANLVLGRLQSDFFPRIFGANRDEPLDTAAPLSLFQDMLREVVASGGNSCGISSVHELALGFLRVANEAMCRPIREMTSARGFDIRSHTLSGGDDGGDYYNVFDDAACDDACGDDTDDNPCPLPVFGGAGGQHACAIARSLGISKVFVHKYASVLSAYGLSGAELVEESQSPAATVLVRGGCAQAVSESMKLVADVLKELATTAGAFFARESENRC
jgi:5-oxoprolinase (ATP-hydrolysing)